MSEQKVYEPVRMNSLGGDMVDDQAVLEFDGVMRKLEGFLNPGEHVAFIGEDEPRYLSVGHWRPERYAAACREQYRRETGGELFGTPDSDYPEWTEADAVAEVRHLTARFAQDGGGEAWYAHWGGEDTLDPDVVWSPRVPVTTWNAGVGS